MTKPFRCDIRQWRSAAALATHLGHYDPGIASWAQGVTIHHTYSPIAAQWHGQRSMDALKRYYRDSVEWVDEHGTKRRGWDAGPHLFLVSGAPDWRDDGIWQLTALNEQGVHAGAYNHTHWGIEVVGDFDHAPWPPLLAETVYSTAAILLRWRSLRPSLASVRGHRECNSPKTCPGTAINMDAVRRELVKRMPV